MKLTKAEAGTIILLAATIGFFLPLEMALATVVSAVVAILLFKNYHFAVLLLLIVGYAGITPAGLLQSAVPLNKIIFAILAFFFVAEYFIKKEKKLFFPNQLFAVIGFMSVAAISTILGTAGGTLSFFLDPKMALTLIFMIYLTRNMKAAKNTFWVLSAIIIIFAGLSLASGGIFEGGGIEFIDRLENRNTLGINLLPLMPLAFAMLLITNKETKPFEGIPKKAFLLLAVLAVFVVIFVTGSRGSIIGVAAMLPMLFYYFPKQKIWPVIAIILLVSAPFFYWKVEDVVSRVQGLGALAGETGNSQFTGAHSIEERKNMLFDALSIFLANPFMGAGYDTSRYLLGLKGYYKNLEKTGELVNYQDAHNIYAEVLAETGIIGFIFYAMIIAFSFWDIGRAEKNFTEKGENDGATMAKCLRVSLVGMLVLGFAGNEPFYLIFIILVALGIILRQVSIDLNKEKQYELGSAGHF